MLFVEVFRFLFVLAGAAAGLEIGHHVGGQSHGPTIGMALGAAIAYVIGGIIGRLLDRGLQGAVFKMTKMPPGEVFAGTIIATSGLLLGLVIGLPFLVLVRSGFELIATATVCWVLAALGWRIGVAKGREVVAAAGLNRILAPPTEPPPGYAMLVDASAVMDRLLLALGRSGMLLGGIVIPQFVVDQIQTLAEGPDPVSSPAGPSGPRGRRRAQGHERPGPCGEGRDPRGGGPRYQAADPGPPSRAADRDVLHPPGGRGRRLGPAGRRPPSAGRRPHARPPAG